MKRGAGRGKIVNIPEVPEIAILSQPIPKSLSLGETNPTNIQKNVQEAVDTKYSVFCLGFGFDVNYPFLEKLALDNGGLARRIYEDSDSALQLQVPGCSKVKAMRQTPFAWPL